MSSDLKSYFHNLVVMAYADSRVCERERRFLAEKAVSLKFDMAYVDRLIKQAPKLQFVHPISFDENIDFLSDVVDMALADGHFHEAEMKLCRRACEIMNMDLEYLLAALSKRGIEVEA